MAAALLLGLAIHNFGIHEQMPLLLVTLDASHMSYVVTNGTVHDW